MHNLAVAQGDFHDDAGINVLWPDQRVIMKPLPVQTRKGPKQCDGSLITAFSRLGSLSRSVIVAPRWRRPSGRTSYMRTTRRLQ